MNKPHVHADIIKAWADGAEIEFFDESYSYWCPMGQVTPSFDPCLQYRVSPKVPANVVLEEYVELVGAPYQRHAQIRKTIHQNNVRLTFHSQTMKLIHAEVIKDETDMQVQSLQVPPPQVLGIMPG